MVDGEPNPQSPQKYQVKIHPQARKGFKALPARLRHRVDEFVHRLEESPKLRIRHQTELLNVGEAVYQWRIDRSNRLIWQVDDMTHEVFIAHIGPHPEGSAYRRIASRFR